MRKPSSSYHIADCSAIAAKPWRLSSFPKRILAIRMQAMGDLVITLPYLQALRNFLPAGTRLDLLTREEVAPIPRALELFDHVYAIGGGRSEKKQLFFSVISLPKLFMNRYQVVLDLQNNYISRLTRKMLMPRAWSAFDRYSPNAAGERTCKTIQAAGFPINLPITRFSLKPINGIPELLFDNGWNGNRLIVLNPAGAFETRNWPLHHYLAFARLWARQFPDSQFLMIGTSFIEQKAAWLKQKLGEKLVNIVGKTTPATAFATLQQADLVLSEDSGLMHMAWVSGIPTIALFGGTRSDWSRPLGEHSAFLDASDLDCGPCMQEACRYGDVHCLDRFTPAMVFDEAVILYNKFAHRATS